MSLPESLDCREGRRSNARPDAAESLAWNRSVGSAMTLIIAQDAIGQVRQLVAIFHRLVDVDRDHCMPAREITIILRRIFILAVLGPAMHVDHASEANCRSRCLRRGFDLTRSSQRACEDERASEDSQRVNQARPSIHLLLLTGM